VVRRVVMAVTVLVGAIAVMGSICSVSADVGTDADLIAQRGFGESANSYSWSMAWFKGKLYVGTARHEACVENVTVDYFLVVSGRYKTNPLPGVECPPDPYSMNLRAEIWQYTPNTGRWRRVYRSPAIPNPSARGKTVGRDIAFRGMTVYRGRLYVGDVTADEYLPGLYRKYPPRILSTADGSHFRSIPAANIVERTVHGVNRPIGFRSLTPWRGRLFVTMTADLTGDGNVYELTRPTSKHPGFKLVTPTNLAIFEMQVFHGSLYIGTGDSKAGYGVYRVTTHHVRVRVGHRGRRHGHVHRRRWRRVVRYGVAPIVTGGAGRGTRVTSVVSMGVFKGWLYVGASGWYNNQGIPVSELIRIDRHGHWQVVAGAARTVDGRPKEPISGLSDGFYNIFAAHFWRMGVYHGAMYIGTNDWSWLIQKAYPGLSPAYLPGIIQSVLSPEFGFDLWASCDGRSWFPVTRDGFGNMYDFGARNLIPTPDGLFVGSANQAQGTKVWRIPVSPCQSLVHVRSEARKRALAASLDGGAPQQLLTDSQRDGNVVSWQPSPGATRYRVMRAAYLTVPLTLQPPPVMPNGFLPEDQVPDIVSPGTPGSEQFDLPLPDDFVPVGTTGSDFYVDRTAKRGQRYAYRVLAEGPSGYQSPPSNTQMAPEPWPRPSFQQVLQAIGSTDVARDRLATAFAADSAQNDRRATLRVLARMQRAVGPDSDPGVLIERLERQLRYAGLAGGH